MTRREQALSSAELAISMRDLSRLGVGWPGTPGELARREYIISRLETFGYACAREPFAFLAYSTEASSTCTSDILGDLLTGPIQYTANGTAEGQLTFVGQGHPEDLDALQEAGVDLRNRLCLARTFAPSTITDDLATWCDWTHRPSRYSGRSHPTPHRTWIPASAPTALDCGNRQDPKVTVSKGAGDRLLAMHGSGLGSVAIEHRATYADAKTENIVAELQGRSTEFVVIVAHDDTQRAGGAWDNDSGVAVLLELARLFRGRRPRVGVHFVAVSGEEAVMWGLTNMHNATRMSFDARA